MVRHELILDLNNELITDAFAGGGGASTGIEEALGRHVDHAVNHDPKALGMHRINHSQTIHHCEDIFSVNVERMSEGRPMGFGWFSPDCRHFSKAKGGKPLSKKIRGLCFVIYRWCAAGLRVGAMENVEEIQTFGPLLHNPKHPKDCECGEPCGHPDPKHIGRTWHAFLDGLSTGIDPKHPDLDYILDTLRDPVTGLYTITREQLIRGFGYTYEFKELRACDYGAPTIRKRLFLIFRKDGKPIVWPKATHGNPAEPEFKESGLKPWIPVSTCIDWTLPCPSIFLEGEAARKAKCKRPLADSTLRRVAAGMDRYVLKAKQPFIVSLTHHGGDRVESVAEPSATITAAHRGEKAFVNVQTAPFVADANRPQNCQAAPADQPLRTQCAEIKGGHFQLVTGTLVGCGGRAAQSPPRSVDEPNGTTTTKADQCLIAANLVEFHSKRSDTDKQERVRGVKGPLPTQTTQKRFAVTAASMIKMRGDPETHGPTSECEAPIDTISAGGTHHGIATAYMVQNNFDRVGKGCDEPCTTVTCKGHQQLLATAYMAQHNAGNNTNPGHPATHPASTISTKGCQQQVVNACLACYYGSEADGQGIEESCRTISTKPRHVLAKSDGRTLPLTPEQIAGAKRVAAFLRKYGVEFEGEFATVGNYVIVDIGIRMLTPRELFRAQGFPESYVIDHAWLIDPHTGDLQEVTLTKEEQIRMCGNSVCPPIAREIVRANVPELIAWRKGERRAYEQKLKRAAPPTRTDTTVPQMELV